MDTEKKVCTVDYKEGEVFIKETYLPDSYLGLYLEKRARTTYVNDQAKVEVEISGGGRTEGKSAIFFRFHDNI